MQDSVRSLQEYLGVPESYYYWLPYGWEGPPPKIYHSGYNPDTGAVEWQLQPSLPEDPNSNTWPIVVTQYGPAGEPSFSTQPQHHESDSTDFPTPLMTTTTTHLVTAMATSPSTAAAVPSTAAATAANPAAASLSTVTSTPASTATAPPQPGYLVNAAATDDAALGHVGGTQLDVDNAPTTTSDPVADEMVVDNQEVHEPPPSAASSLMATSSAAPGDLMVVDDQVTSFLQPAVGDQLTGDDMLAGIPDVQIIPATPQQSQESVTTQPRNTSHTLPVSHPTAPGIASPMLTAPPCPEAL